MNTEGDAANQHRAPKAERQGERGVSEHLPYEQEAAQTHEAAQQYNILR